MTRDRTATDGRQGDRLPAPAPARGRRPAGAQSRGNGRIRCYRGDFAEVQLPPLPDVQGMITDHEARYLYWLTSRCYRGEGAVVELGSWMGRSAVHLGAGLRRAGHHDALHCFDRFTWGRGQERKTRAGLKPGSSYTHLFEASVRPVYPGVKVHQGEFADATWSGGPIEILFVDAPKQLPAISDALAIFGPHLIPGRSIIACQDYLHFPSYPLPAVLSRLDDRLRVVHEVTGSSTVGFLLTAPLNVQAAQPLDWDFLRWTRREAEAQWLRIAEPLSSRGRTKSQAGLAMLLHDVGEIEAACALLARYADEKAIVKAFRSKLNDALYRRYQPLFAVLGVHPERASQLTRLGRAVGPASHTPRQRGWVERSVRRALRGLGLGGFGAKLKLKAES